MLREIDFRCARKTQLASTALSREGRDLLERVSLKVHPNDGMYETPPGAQLYLSVGLSAIHCIDEALGKNANVQTILDFPSGYGRILRFLKVKFPSAEIVACEVDPMALEFCKRTFAVRTIMSDKKFRNLSLPLQFDLIWSGSLITHLNEKLASDLLWFFHEHLAPGGLCLVTTHGRTSLEWIESKAYTYGLSANAQEKLLSEFHKSGYGYTDYESMNDYGISVVSHDRMTQIASVAGQWVQSVFLESGWGNHHDVYGFTKAESGNAADSRSPVREHVDNAIRSQVAL
jgi:SAM-dependent methyltransferase